MAKKTLIGKATRYDAVQQIIEEIAKQWFQTDGTSRLPDWDKQPERIKEHYRSLARRFWRRPGEMFHHLRSAAIWARQIDCEIRRATNVYLDEAKPIEIKQMNPPPSAAEDAGQEIVQP